ncbi:MAG: STAS/SEC14 domain-containing protein [Syntrophaceae bacterium]|nr:STAS/SEC14 domain-containing protein [Syntrophaceae bacterium]
MPKNKSKKKSEDKNIINKVVGDVRKLLRTSVFAGLGVAFNGQEMIEKLIKDIAKENNLSIADVKRFIKDIKKQGLEARKDIGNRAKKVIKDISQITKKPEYDISSSKKEGIVEVALTGKVTKDTLEKVVKELYSILKPMKIKKLLADIRFLKMPREYITAYSSVIENLPPLRVKTAFVDHSKHADFQKKFNEIAANNAGVPLKYFTDINKARIWLKSK